MTRKADNMDYVKLKSRSTIQGFIGTLAALLALSIGMVGLAGCSSGTSDEDAIRASLSSELDSIKNIDDAFVNEFSESIDMSQLSVYGIDGVEFMKSYLSGFDYTIDSINVDGDSATAQITLTCKSYTGYLQALQTAVDEVTADPDALAALSNDEINQKIKEAEMYAEEDKKKKEAIDTRNEADAMVFQTEKAIKEVGDKLDANDKAAVEADMQALKDVLAKSTPENTSEADVAEIKAAKEKLMESAQKLFTKMYEQAGAAAGAGAAGPNPGQDAGPAPEGFNGDDVVDGDYKEV